MIVFTNGLPLDILNINWFIKLARGMRRATTDSSTHNSGMAKSEDPTEGSIFGRVNVKTIMLIEKFRRTSYEKLNSVIVNQLVASNLTVFFSSSTKRGEKW